jgi:dihydroorotase (homodimeric type)
VGATITAHHLLLNRNALFLGGIRPHHYCLPVLKREEHREALVEAAISGNPKFFLGTDSAPHAVPTKETACGCAGIFTAPAALELYAEVFDEEAALDRFEAFASLNGPAFYRLPVNERRVTLHREAWTVPERIGEGDLAVGFLDEELVASEDEMGNAVIRLLPPHFTRGRFDASQFGDADILTAVNTIQKAIVLDGRRILTRHSLVV